MGIAFMAIGLQVPCRAAETRNQSAADLLPGSVVALLEITDLPHAINVGVNHPLRDQVVASPVVQAVLESDDLKRALPVVGGFEATMGMPAIDAISEISKEGITLAFDAKSQGFAALIKCSNQDLLQRLHRFVLAIAQTTR
ncbi:MAG: hypothetical protein AAGJ83_03420, partial [Planctomycetota bacterium]